MNKNIIFVVVIIAIAAGFYIFKQSGQDILPINYGNGGETNEPAAQGKCYIGGCSNQICSDQEGVVSTCEYREEYACYQSAKCERQASGECGWTMTSELRMCLGQSDF